MYKNPWHQQHNIYSKEYYQETKNPTIYKGYAIHKVSDVEYHVVKNNVCCGMLAGPNGAKQKIDKITTEL